MKTYAFDFSKNKITQYSSKVAAQACGNGRILAATKEEFAAERLTGDQLVGLYNALTPLAPIKRFETKATGIDRIWLLAEAKAVVAVETPSSDAAQGSAAMKKEEKVLTEKVKKEKKPKAEKAEASKRGRVSEFAGKKLFANVENDENPRREGSNGYASMEIIMNAGKNGIAYDDFIAAGGRRIDLAWDHSKGYVTLSE